MKINWCCVSQNAEFVSRRGRVQLYLKLFLRYKFMKKSYQRNVILSMKRFFTEIFEEKKSNFNTQCISLGDEKNTNSKWDRIILNHAERKFC